jgi:hypothetical protein
MNMTVAGKYMSRLLLAFAVLVPAAARSAELELELAPGAAVSNDASEAAPTLRARLGLRFPYFTPSLLFFGAATSTPGPPSHNNQDGGLQAWAFAAEARVHSAGENQVWAGAGAGWGQLIVAQPTNGDLAKYAGEAAPYVEVSAGYRRHFGKLSIGLDATLHLFNRVSFFSDVGTDPHTGRLYVGGSAVLGAALSIGFDLGG